MTENRCRKTDKNWRENGKKANDAVRLHLFPYWSYKSRKFEISNFKFPR